MVVEDLLTIVEDNTIMAKNNNKTERISIRLSIEDKRVIKEAALINKTSISDYILSVVIIKAQLDIKENEKLILSSKASKQILDELSNPSEPNEALINLFGNR